MTEGSQDAGRDAPVMASWDDSGPVLDTVSSPPQSELGSATTAVERARRLLKQLLAKQPRDDWSPLPKP
jgi:hypothetical protein